MFKVTLLSKTEDPIGTICKHIAIMKEKDPLGYVEGLSEEEKRNMVNEILKTRLRGALESVSFEFLIEGCSRTFTHQLVRHRTFHFSQQSMRFFDASSSEFYNPIEATDTESTIHKTMIDAAANDAINSYKELLEAGVPIQDARSILPQDITTKIIFGCNLRGLLDMAEVRMCTQTQGQFRKLMDQVKYILGKEEPFLASKLKAACEVSGRCEFQSIYDRTCGKHNLQATEPSA